MLSRVYVSHICAFSTVSIWAFAYVYTKVALLHFSAASLGFLRCAIAAVVLLAIALAKKGGLPKLRDVPIFFFSGLLGLSLYQLLFNTGAATLTAATSCILISTAPVISVLLASVLYKERLNAIAWAAICLEFSGVLVLALWEGGLSINSGVFWVMGAAISISAYNLLQRKFAGRYSALQITAYSFFFATLSLLMFTPEALSQLATAPQSQVMTVLFLGIFPSAIAYMLWAKALSIAANTGVVTNYMFLTPPISMLLGYMVLAERPDAGTLLGGTAILSGLALYNFAGKKK